MTTGPLVGLLCKVPRIDLGYKQNISSPFMYMNIIYSIPENMLILRKLIIYTPPSPPIPWLHKYATHSYLVWQLAGDYIIVPC